jgi:hypothetical protein
MAVLSERLRKSIEAYCALMDGQGLDDLARVIESGSASWFPEEFSDALRAGAITPQEWEKLTDVAMDDDDHELLDEYLRAVWSTASPGRAYPLDGAPGGSPGRRGG